jgi:LmbE family N-acetylglucosaminyl deacetylase
MAKTILGIGAHYDDCIFGISGTLLGAVRKNHRVVILSLIGDYSNWKPAQGREKEIVQGTIDLSKEYAEAVAQIEPDIAFILWPHDSHSDHEAASRLAKIALSHGDRLLPPGRRFKSPQQVYQFDNGPRHTVGFEPDTFVDISNDWRQASEWLGRLMALVRGQPFDPTTPDGATQAKESLARYRGQTCGVRYAEAFRALHAYSRELF